MNEIVTRLKEYLEYKNIKPSQAEAAIGVSNGTLSKPFNKGTSIKTDTLEKFLREFAKINPVWLFNGIGSIEVKENDFVNEPSAVYKLKTDSTEEEQSIPLYNLEASAGLVSLFNNQADQKPIDYLRIPNLPKCDGALTVTGDSMYPLLKSGDIIMYKELNNEIANIFFGEMYLVSLDLDGDEYISVKWVQRSDKGEEYIRLVSENQHHQPKDVHLKKVRALALVKASVRINAMG
jgi:phage repressor protein C with HTH and peptisase S24 domain